MKLSSFMKEDYFFLDLEIKDKEECLKRMVEFISKDKNIKSKEGILQDLLNRERLGSTGIGHKIAIPHCKSASISKSLVAFARLKEGIDFSSEDGQPVSLIFMVLSPEEKNNEQLKILSQIAQILDDSNNRERLLNISNYKEFLEIINVC